MFVDLEIQLIKIYLKHRQRKDQGRSRKHNVSPGQRRLMKGRITWCWSRHWLIWIHSFRRISMGDCWDVCAVSYNFRQDTRSPASSTCVFLKDGARRVFIALDTIHQVTCRRIFIVRESTNRVLGTLWACCAGKSRIECPKIGTGLGKSNVHVALHT